MATDLDRWVFSVSLRRIWASSFQQFPSKSMLKSQIQLSQYDRCKTQRPKEFKECRPFQIYQSALGLPRQPAAVSRRSNPPEEAKRWLVDLKRPASLEFLWSLSIASIMLRKLYLWLQHRFARKLLDGWSSNSVKRYRKNSSIKIHRHSGEIFSIFALIPVSSGGGRCCRPLSCKPCLPFLC